MPRPQDLFPSLLLSLLVLTVPSTAIAQDADAVLRAYIEVWNSGEVDHLDQLVTPDFRRHAGPEESPGSIAGLKRIIERTRTIYSHLRITVDDQMTEGDRGASRGRFTGVHRDVNAMIDFPLMSIYRFVDGRIAEEWIVGDNFLTLVTLGYELVPPGFEAFPPDQQPDPVADSHSEDGG